MASPKVFHDFCLTSTRKRAGIALLGGVLVALSFSNNAALAFDLKQLFSPFTRESQTHKSSDSPAKQGRRPRNRTSGGSRNPSPGLAPVCHAPLVALVPGEGNVSIEEGCDVTNSLAIHSMTAMRSPTVWFYMPDMKAPGLKGELVLLDENKQPIHTSIHELGQMGGVFPIAFGYELKPNVTYDWQFSVVLNPDSPSENMMVESSIEYQPNLSIVSRQDQLHQTAKKACLNPNDMALKQAWKGALTSVDLAGMVDAPWMSCQTPGVEVSQNFSSVSSI